MSLEISHRSPPTSPCHIITSLSVLPKSLLTPTVIMDSLQDRLSTLQARIDNLKADMNEIRRQQVRNDTEVNNEISKILQSKENVQERVNNICKQGKVAEKALEAEAAEKEQQLKAATKNLESLKEMLDKYQGAVPAPETQISQANRAKSNDPATGPAASAVKTPSAALNRAKFAEKRNLIASNFATTAEAASSRTEIPQVYSMTYRKPTKTHPVSLSTVSRDKLTSKYRTIVKDQDGDYYELRCCICGANASPQHLQSGSSTAFFSGVSGLTTHMTHHPEFQQWREDGGRPMEIIIEKCAKKLSVNEVEDLRQGRSEIRVEVATRGSERTNDGNDATIASALRVE